MLNVTIRPEFLSDPDLWVNLRTNILPNLALADRPLRALCVGTGPGMEALSLAMVLSDLEIRQSWSIKAFDVNAASIAVARAGGPYNLRDMRHLSAENRTRYFDRTPEGYIAKREISRRIDFVVEDLRNVKIGEGYDLILYRNVEPFFTTQQNRNNLRRIHGALRPGGVVFQSSHDLLPAAHELGFARIGRGVLRRHLVKPLRRVG